jgi:hypothetical protein
MHATAQQIENAHLTGDSGTPRDSGEHAADGIGDMVHLDVLLVVAS